MEDLFIDIIRTPRMNYSVLIPGGPGLGGLN